jgi:hypothetical protein
MSGLGLELFVYISGMWHRGSVGAFGRLGLEDLPRIR